MNLVKWTEYLVKLVDDFQPVQTGPPKSGLGGVSNSEYCQIYILGCELARSCMQRAMSTTTTTTTTTENDSAGEDEQQSILTLRPISYKSLHPTFVAEVQGCDLTHPTPELVQELKNGLAKVSRHLYRGNKAESDSTESWSFGNLVWTIIPMSP